jgi:DNA-binding MarR family transcriptional regulator
MTQKKTKELGRATSEEDSRIRPDSDLAKLVPMDNLRRLLRNLAESLDLRLSEFLKNTPYERVRPSDAQVIVNVARGHDRISELAKHLSISRQAVHMSAQRLQQMGLVELKQVPNNKRDKRITITATGQRQIRRGAKEMADAEVELTGVIGATNMAKLRKQLVQMDEYFVTRRAGRKA